MSGITVSVYLNEKEAKRFQRAADKHRLSLNAFLKHTAEQLLEPTDTAQDFRLLSADLRSDIRKELSRVSEQSAVLTSSNADHLREMFTGFLLTLHEDQKEILMKASGLTSSKPPRRPADHPLTTPMPPKF